MEEAPREVTPPQLQAPSAKEKKYDRQLRLWAASGQRALEESHVLLVVGEDASGSNSSVAGAETLKNLILPGIGNFTIADSANVTEADLGVNFFLEDGSLHKSRAEELTRLLQELNPDVTGHSVSTPLMDWLPQEGSLRPYNLILLCAPIPEEALRRVSTYATQSSIPMVYIQSVGFYSSFSVQLPHEFPIVDTHPDPDSTQDLRLLTPWTELSDVVDSLGDLKKMADHDHGHVPYLLLLVYYLREWKAAHGSYPSTFKEKTQFRDLIRSNARTDNAEGGEENYNEACAAVLKTITEHTLTSGCKEMFEMPSCTNLHAGSSSFWLIAHAIKSYYTRNHRLPLPGTLPDMKATSSEYVKLQNLYKSKARTDVAEVTTQVRALEQSLHTHSFIPAIEIESFCKNAAHVCVLTNPDNLSVPTLRLASSDPDTISKLRTELENDWEDMLPIFIALNTSSKAELDVSTFTTDSEKGDFLKKAVSEVQRAGGGELHNISSVTGGMVAQEAIKLLTRQYVPVDGTCVFDGIRSKSAVFKI